MKQRLREKLERLRRDLNCGDFILADAKDADMAFGVASPGRHYPPDPSGRELRSIPEFHDQIRDMVHAGDVDIMLASVATMSLLAHEDGLFDESDVTPAIRANDTTDIWVGRGARYPAARSQPFATTYIAEAQHNRFDGETPSEPKVNLGLYSMTFTNGLETDREHLRAFRDFRAEAARHGFRYFLEIFAPNVNSKVSGLAPEAVPGFVNDQICRALAGVSRGNRPEFLKIPFFGPAALEELVSYDPSLIIGILGGSSGTTMDAFTLLAEARKYGARAALFGRKIKDAEHPLTFVRYLRRITASEIEPQEAVRAYHADLEKLTIPPIRKLDADLKLTATELHYSR